MPGVTVGVYEGDLTAGTEVSSTYEGRHLTVRDDELIHPVHADAFVDKGDPVVLCDAGVPTTYGRAVGVAFKSGAAASTMISLDTEGIFNLQVYADNDDGAIEIEIGDRLYIRAGALTGAVGLDGTGDAEISKITDKNTQVPFGYALGSMVAGGEGIIAVKVHWDPTDPMEVVGSRAVPFVSDVASKEFRTYRYEGQGGTTQVGFSLELEMTTVAGYWAAAMFLRLGWTNSINMVTGYCAVLELELDVGAGVGTLDTMTVLQFNSNVGATGSHHNNIRQSWMRMQDYAGAVGGQPNIFVELIDDLGTYPGANDATTLFVASSGDVVVTHTLRIMVNGVIYYILCATGN